MHDESHDLKYPIGECHLSPMLTAEERGEAIGDLALLPG